MEHFRQRLVFLPAIGKNPWVRILLVLWALSGVYDLALSQWIPEEYAKRLPKIYRMVAMTAGLASWQVWLLVGATITVGAAIEYAFRKTGLATVRVGEVPALPQPKEPSRYMNAYEVIHYLADDSKWGHQTRQHISANGMRKNALLEAQVEFKRIAEQGYIRSFGRRNGAGEHVDIAKTYWLSATLSPFSLDNPEISEAIPAVYNPDGIPTYKRVKIVREDVERTWPRSVNRPQAPPDTPRDMTAKEPSIALLRHSLAIRDDDSKIREADQIIMRTAMNLLDGSYPNEAAWATDYEAWELAMRRIDSLVPKWVPQSHVPFLDLKYLERGAPPPPPQSNITSDTNVMLLM
jgi:hypothetical protein